MENKFLAAWVSVKDRTPIDGKDCLIKNGDNLGIGFFVVEDMFWSISINFYSNPTHWLELIPITE